MPFDGKTYERPLDQKRLGSQLQRVKQFTADGEWHTLADIIRVCGGNEASVSARLRDLRKEKFGEHRVERRRVKGGLHEYRVLPPLPKEPEQEQTSMLPPDPPKRTHDQIQR